MRHPVISWMHWLAISAFAANITLKFVSTPLPKALARLGSEVGERWEASPSLADEVLMVRLNGVPAAEVQRRLSDLYDAEWGVRPDGTKVLRPDARRKRDRDAEYGRHGAEVLTESLKYVAKRLAGQADEFGPAQAADVRRRIAAEDDARKRAEEAKDYDRMFITSTAIEETPSWRALARVLATFPKDELLRMAWNGREVWAERPTRLQHPFGPAAAVALRAYRDELAEWKPDFDAARVRVVVKRWEHGVGHNVSLEALDASGKTVDQAFIRLNNDSSALKIPYSSRNQISPAGNELPLTMSKDAREWSRVLNSEGPAARDLEALRTKWRPILTNPERYEPTAWLPSEGFVAAAEALNLNLIGAPSELTGVNYAKPGKGETARQFLARNKSGLDWSGNWLTFRSDEPRPRIPRARGGQLLRSMQRQGGLSVDEAAAFAAQTPVIWPFTNWVGEAMVLFGNSGGRHGYLGTTMDDTLLRFWAGLGPVARKSLFLGQEVSLTELPLGAGRELQRMIFDEERLGNRIEPTEVFSDGVRGTVRLKVTDVPIFKAWRDQDGPDSNRLSFTAAEFGRLQVRGDAYRELPAQIFQSADRYLLGRERQLMLTFSFGNGIAAHEEALSEVFFPPTSNPTATLPESLAKEVATAREAARTEAGKGSPKPASLPPPARPR